MGTLPRVAIVGRPNVGKSSLFNRLAGRRLAIVEPTAGVTRDRIEAEVSLGRRPFVAVDTGGIGLVDEEGLASLIQAQIDHAIETADVLVLLVDARDGITPLDREIAERFRGIGKPLLLVANKCETRGAQIEAGEFHALGLGAPKLVSALDGHGLDDLVGRIVRLLPKAERTRGRKGEPPLRLAIVGRRNAGKSTLVNRLAGEERVIVSDVPGTTRDAVDVEVEFGGKRLVVIDTAGLRRRKSIGHAIDYFSLARAAGAIRRADVVLHLFDCTEEISEVDKRLADEVVQLRKPCVLAANKWDLAGDAEPGKFRGYLDQKLPGLAFAPVSFLSAGSGFHVKETIDLAFELHAQAGALVPTTELNAALEAARTERVPRAHGKDPKLYYATQVGVRPPTVLVFVNHRRLFGEDYDRFLQKRLREATPWAEVPIRLVYRERVRNRPKVRA
ncbi:MAG TPA: ribosome biogenesis GTPase Der [Planctomycetota bacterium]|jgi:GTP-binding protein|nr:ribosome biogenesis GTPase Der [Planctomycetota bacterium]